MKMNNKLIKTLGIALIAIVLGTGFVAAYPSGPHTIHSDDEPLTGPTYHTEYGDAYLKAGALEIGKYMVFDDNVNAPHGNAPVTDEFGNKHFITFWIGDDGNCRITSVGPYTEPEPQNETPAVPVVENATETVNNTVANNTEHASGDDVTVAPAINNTVENATEPDLGSIVMENAGNPYFLLVIAIFLLIGAVAYNKRH